MDEKKLTLDTIFEGNKTLNECLSENFDKTKKKVFEKIREGITPDEEALSKLHIKRIVNKPVITQIVFDRVIRKDEGAVYKKDTTKLEKILEELNTLTNEESDE